MFGHINAYKPDMKMRDYETYKSVYCSLCKELGHDFGPFMRVTLNYDFTFLAILNMSLSENCTSFKKSHCTFNPFIKCCKCTSNKECLDFASNSAAIMLYYKVKDNINDSGFFKKILMFLIYPFALLAHNKAKKLYPNVEKIISDSMESQTRLENEKCDNIDMAAEPTAKALAELLSINSVDETEKRILNRMGYCLGRWVYIIDAVEDIEDDLKTGSYNPFVISRKLKKDDSDEIKSIKEYAGGVLNLTACEAIKAFELLHVKRYNEILSNILYEGLENTKKRILS